MANKIRAWWRRRVGRSASPQTKRKLTDEKVEEILRLTLQTKPKGQTHWSTRQLAKKLGVSQSSVGRVWRAFKLQPHRQSTFTLSTDDFFVEKVRDVVGLYMNKPENAVVLCVDEKSQIQALERGQPVLPMIFGKPKRKTPSYLRHGTTTLFAATGHRDREGHWQMLRAPSGGRVPQKDLDVHVVMDNYSTHSAPEIQRWLKRHRRFHFHFTPTYSSWLNQVERWFALLTERAIKQGVHRSTAELKKAIEDHVNATNEAPKPFVWRKTADEIIAAVARHAQHVFNLNDPS